LFDVSSFHSNTLISVVIIVYTLSVRQQCFEKADYAFHKTISYIN
jgi:hypothetical protein